MGQSGIMGELRVCILTRSLGVTCSCSGKRGSGLKYKRGGGGGRGLKYKRELH